MWSWRDQLNFDSSYLLICTESFLHSDTAEALEEEVADWTEHEGADQNGDEEPVGSRSLFGGF